MPKRLRAILVSVPFITLAVLFVLYTAFGFLAVPALLKWQIEKQVPEQLGQRVSVGEVRFNPFLLRLDAGDLAVSDSKGNALFGFKHLRVNFLLASVIERAWTFGELALDAPLVHFERDKDGRHNFATMLERLGGGEPGGAMPRVVIRRLVLREGRVEFLDRLLEAPLVTRVAPMLIEIENFSTLPEASAPYRFTARTAANETLEVAGALGLNPLSLKGKVKLGGIKLQTLTRALSRELALDAPAGTLDASADVDIVVDARGAAGGGASNVDLQLAGLSLRAPGAGAPLMAAETLSLKDGRIDLAAREVTIGAIRLANGNVAAAIDAQGRGDWSGFVPASSGSAAEVARGARPGGSAKPWRISVAGAEIAQIALQFSDLAKKRNVAVAALELRTSAALEVGPGAVRGTVGEPRVLLSGVTARQAEDQLSLQEILLVAKSPAFEFGSAGLRVTVGESRLSLAKLTAQRGADQVAVRELSLEAKSLTSSTDSTSSSIEAGVQGLALRIASVGLRGQGRTGEFAQFSEARVGASSLMFRRTGVADAPDVIGEGLTAALNDAVLRDPDAVELARIGLVSLSGGALRLRERTVGFDKAVVVKGKMKGWLDAKGTPNWLNLFAPSATKARMPDTGLQKANEKVVRPKSQAAGKAPPAPAEKPWRIALKEAQLGEFAVDFEDRRRSPALALGLDAIGVQVTGFDSGSSRPIQVALKARVRSGGDIEARGKVSADLPSADLQVKLARIALAPVQPFVSDFALLHLAGGSVSAAGRLRYGEQGKDAAKLAYTGSLSIDGVQFQEGASRRPFLSWASISSGDIVATLESNRVDIGELRVDKLVGKVIIAEDRTINLLDVLKKPGGEAAPGTQAAAPPGAQKDADPFPVTIARVRVSDGTLEFADLSLRPQFGTRMHELKGVITGLGTDMTRSAQVQLDARVDTYGSAKIRGRISALRPQRSTDIALEFRNLEMTALSPYVEKFAGYRIAAGRLALDLSYKLRDGKLEGQNKIVLNKIELGEKVNSPGALDLPLELAIAILKDSDGVIDIGVPVSGDLNDPKFDYGAVIGKAIGNLFASIITAPFRALGALFGGGEKEIDTIAFEPGSDALAPPERQKLVSVARALKERPTLMLKVSPTYAPKADTAALKSYAVRADIVRRMGMEQRAGEDPGPLDAANPRVQKAVEAAFGERYAPAVFAELKSRAAQASAVPSEATMAATPAEGADVPTQVKAQRMFYRGLIDRLIHDAPVTEQTVLQLATRRSEAIVRELTTVGGVPAARSAPGEPRKAEGEDLRVVELKLELGVAK